MAIFQVHPHFGYLNSDVKLVNGSDEPITVRDSAGTAEDGFVVPAQSSISVRLTAGKHLLTVDGAEAVRETVVVEDAVKLGGSKEKKAYIFEGTPWMLMVMLDRTYFYNRENGEQYVEHGLVPQDVKFLSSEYLLFVSGRDNSLFSLDSLTVVKTMGESSMLFHNDIYAVFSTPEGVVMFPLSGKEEMTIACKDYAVDAGNQVLYCFKGNDDRELKAWRLSDNTQADWEPIRLEYSFRCFVGCRSAVYGEDPRSLSTVNLATGESAKLYDSEFPVTAVNGKKVWENGAAKSMELSTIKDAFTVSSELEVHECQDHWLCQMKTEHVMKLGGSMTTKINYRVYSTKSNLVIPVKRSDKPVEIIDGKSFSCVDDGSGSVYAVFSKSVRRYEGKAIVSPGGYVLIVIQGEDLSEEFIDPLRPSYSHPASKLIPSRDRNAITDDITLFRETGLVREDIVSEVDDGKSHVCYQDVERRRLYDYRSCERMTLSGFYWLEGVSDAYVRSHDGVSMRMPYLKNRIVALSEQCNYAVVRGEDGFEINSFVPIDSYRSDWQSHPLGVMKIDRSFFCKAVFCADGENIIYSKGGSEYYLRRVGSDEESVFEVQGSVVRRNINGYVPYLDFDSRRRPVYVDPVTLGRVDYEAAGQFTFQSVDGKIRHVGHNFVKYFSYEKNRYVSENEYWDYMARLEFNIPLPDGWERMSRQEIMDERVKYYEENRNWIEKKHKSCASMTAFTRLITIKSAMSFTNLIFRREYYVREEVNGEIVEIKLPEELYFLNYVSYSYDDRYIIISGRFPLTSSLRGIVLVYDVHEHKVVYESTSKTMAVWLGVFSRKGGFAYYDSTPDTYIADGIQEDMAVECSKIDSRSFLAFSPSGRYAALSRQGYIPYCSGNPHWGHQPSRDVYVVRSEYPYMELALYRDHGEQIEGTGGWDRSNSSVASATFSKDEKKLMTVSKDGVVVIRNLHLEDNHLL